jgi:N12 class adenine-specific DNA methylase
VLGDLRQQDRPADPDEQAVLARWSGWGALPGVFDERNSDWADVRAQLRALLSEEAWAAARRTTINAHYTSAEVVAAIWAAVESLGFEGGRVLEPGCGSGNFIGLAPAHLRPSFVGVELDPTTAAVAAALYPHADIRAEGFEHTRLPAGSVDLVVGNVPFGKVALHDPVHNPARHSIHNHFVLKSLALTHPGGLVAVLTSRYTLDARNPAARREMAEMGDLVGAVRLPAGAFRANAGTDAVTDVLLLRRRDDGDTGRREPWAALATVATDDGEVELNEWFARHPELVLGRLRATGGQYRDDELTVVAGDEPLAPALQGALMSLAERGRVAGLGWAPAPRQASPVVAEAEGLARARKEGAVLATPEGGFAQVQGGVARRFEVKPKSDRAELGALLGLRDALADLLDAQAQSYDDAVFAAAQAALNAAYDAYSRRFGALNRFSLVRTGRSDPTTGRPTYRRVRPRMGGFAADPDFYSVLALEVFDPDTQTATKAPVFSARVVAPRQPRRGAERAEDALAICLDEHGAVDLGVIAGLLGLSPERARAELGTLVWEDPGSGDLLPATTYLSGDVRAKLATAVAAADRDPRFEGHVEALSAVLPPDLGPGEIDARLGAAWIPATDVEAFAREVLGAVRVVVDHAPVTATWAVAAETWERRSVAATSTWGTERADAVSLLQSSLNQRAASVYDHLDDGSRVLNQAETLAAREKQEALEARFSAWVWEDPGRAERLGARYNELFNATVLPRYDGSHLSLPGLSSAFVPHPHQRDATWRMVQEPTVLLAHAVGAGKTATMVMGGMELRRLGLVAKPAYVVPNHMLEQFAREFLQLYPQARVLVAGKAETTAGARKHFVARCATGDWDAVVLTHSAFERIPVSAATKADFLTRRLGELREAIAASKGLTVKRLETRMANLEERHKALLADERHDDGVTFEATGLDYICCDEAHYYKNRQFPTHIDGVGGQGSKRAEDLEMKLECLRARHGSRVATFATATPVANSLAEMYVMQAYLQPEVLARAGVSHFDAWAANFGRTVTALELAPDGASYRLNSRFARFRNVPELLTMFRATADVRCTEELDLAAPAIAGGGPQTVVVPASEQLRDYMTTLAGRAERVRNRAVTAHEDNMLKISGDGRRAALDLRLVGQAAPADAGKIGVAAERIASIFHATAAAVYREATGLEAPRRGALQLVFCDLGTPNDGAWSVYEELRAQLVRRGVPREAVAFIHDAGDDRAKAELFAACRSGRVAVLIGSTEKMGVGTNVQDRLTALHHLDCPWRPADIEQREGRALRQGNQNAEVSIVRYVTEGSFDIFMWQTVERKAAFIHQVMRGNVAGREVDDVGEQALSYAEVKALASGSPLLLEKAGVDNEVARLARLRRAHHQDQSRLARVAETAEARAVRLRAAVVECQEAIARRVPTRGDRFRVTLDGETHTARTEAGRRLRATLAEAATGPPRAREVGVLGGFPVDVVAERDALGTTVHVQLRGAPVRVSFGGHEIAGTDPVGLIQRLEHRLGSLEDARDGAARELARVEGEIDTARSRLGAPFAEEARLATLLGRQAEITRALEAELETTVAVAPDQSSAARGTGPGADVGAAAPPAGGAPEFSATPAGVRAALEAVVAHGYGGGARSRYEAALEMLGRLAPIPGQLGDALAAVLGSPVDPPSSALRRICRSLGQPPSVHRQTGTESESTTDGERVAGLQKARDASFDRVLAALCGASLGPEAVADVRAWAGVHDRAVDALVSAHAADMPLLAQLGSAALGVDAEVSRLAPDLGPWH